MQYRPQTHNPKAMAAHAYAVMGNRLHFDGRYADLFGISSREVLSWCHRKRTLSRRGFLFVDVV